jgi:hypothetical protein
VAADVPLGHRSHTFSHEKKRPALHCLSLPPSARAQFAAAAPQNSALRGAQPTNNGAQKATATSNALMMIAEIALMTLSPSSQQLEKFYRIPRLKIPYR